MKSRKSSNDSGGGRKLENSRFCSAAAFSLANLSRSRRFREYSLSFALLASFYSSVGGLPFRPLLPDLLLTLVASEVATEPWSSDESSPSFASPFRRSGLLGNDAADSGRIEWIKNCYIHIQVNSQILCHKGVKLWRIKD